MVNGKLVATFQVTGITCLDCAQKFEKAVRELPGIVRASLNSVTGKLTVEGAADLAAIRRLGQEEDYTIEAVEQIVAPSITIFQVDGITCLDCAKKFEKAVGELTGVIKASLNTMTGKLTVEGDANFKAIQELGKNEDYTVVIAPQAGSIHSAVFQVEGITCLDCAQKFEKAVGGMPDVTKASLNTVTGKLTVEGRADLAGIRQLGLEENYTIQPETGQAAQP